MKNKINITVHIATDCMTKRAAFNFNKCFAAIVRTTSGDKDKQKLLAEL